MGIQVTFSVSDFRTLFPQFNNIPTGNLTGVILNLAEQYCRNDGGGPVNSYDTQSQLLNLMVAHICQLFYGSNGNSPSGLVGMITDAQEGSVQVSAEFPLTQNNAWYMQTPFGAAFWQLTAQYRIGQYVPQTRFRGPYYPNNGVTVRPNVPPPSPPPNLGPIFASLPTEQPTSPGIAWNNGGVIMIS